MKIWQIAAVSVAAGLTLPALAQMGGSPTTRAEVESNVKERLGKFDANKDGTVSSEEMRAYAEARMAKRSDETFAAMDADKNGSVSRAEYDAWSKTRGDRMVRIERMTPPAPPMPGAAPTPDGKPVVRREMRIMTMDGHGDGKGPHIMAMSSSGSGIVIADAVKKALERFDAMDTDKNGTISPEERKAQRERWRMRG